MVLIFSPNLLASLSKSTAISSRFMAGERAKRCHQRSCCYGPLNSSTSSEPGSRNNVTFRRRPSSPGASLRLSVLMAEMTSLLIQKRRSFMGYNTVKNRGEVFFPHLLLLLILDEGPGVNVLHRTIERFAPISELFNDAVYTSVSR